MPHSNGRIYSEVVNGVKVGINTDDVGAVLGSGSHDCWTLCNYSNIKKWSERKPVDDNTSLTDTPEDLADEDFAAANYGLVVPDIVGNPTLCTTLWSYRERRWGRITDFDGYDHNSMPPFTGDGDREMYMDSESIVFTGCGSAPPPMPGIKTINWPSMAAMQNMYFCVALKCSNGDVYVKTCADTIDSERSLAIAKSELPFKTAGTEYTYYIVAATLAVTALTKVGSIAGNKPSYRSLPSDVVLSGKMTLVNKTIIDFSVTGIGAAGSAVTTGSQGVMTAIGAMVPTTTGTRQHITTSGGAIALAIKITNTGTGTATITKNNFTATITNSLSQTNSGTESSRFMPSKIYTVTSLNEGAKNPSGTAWTPVRYNGATEVTSVDVAPGTPKYILVFFSDLMFIGDNNTKVTPTGAVTRSSNISFYFTNGGVTARKGTVNVYASNQ